MYDVCGARVSPSAPQHTLRCRLSRLSGLPPTLAMPKRRVEGGFRWRADARTPVRPLDRPRDAGSIDAQPAPRGRRGAQPRRVRIDRTARLRFLRPAPGLLRRLARAWPGRGPVSTRDASVLFVRVRRRRTLFLRLPPFRRLTRCAPRLAPQRAARPRVRADDALRALTLRERRPRFGRQQHRRCAARGVDDELSNAGERRERERGGRRRRRGLEC